MMNGFRYRHSGWFGESYRHYLASKGIRSRYSASKASIFADRQSHTPAKMVNREILELQKWDSGGKGDFIEEKVKEGMSLPEAVIYADKVEDGLRRQIRKDIRHRRERKEEQFLDYEDREDLLDRRARISDVKYENWKRKSGLKS